MMQPFIYPICGNTRIETTYKIELFMNQTVLETAATSAPKVRLNGAFALIRNSEGKVLVTRRKTGKLDLPGGGQKDGEEDGFGAVHREVYAEIGLSLLSGKKRLYCGGTFQQRVPEFGPDGKLSRLHDGWAFLFVHVPPVDHIESKDFECCPWEVSEVLWLSIEEIIDRRTEFSLGMGRMLLAYLNAELLENKHASSSADDGEKSVIITHPLSAAVRWESERHGIGYSFEY